MTEILIETLIASFTPLRVLMFLAAAALVAIGVWGMLA